jgi:uncharacterized membrane protein YfcA
LRALISAVIGFGSGIASGAFGIGGALLSTPGIRWFLDAPPRIAVGTTLPVIIPTAIVGVFTYAREGLVEVRQAATMAAAGGGFAVLGALITEFIPGEALLVATAALILFLALRMIPARTSIHPPRLRPTVPVLLVVGAVSGLISGLLGIGGGVILVPVLMVLLRFPVKTALGTSLAVVAAQAIPGTVTHSLIGNVDWRIAAGLVVGVVPGARIGSVLAVRTEDAKLRVVVGIAMAALALAFGIGELRSLLR